MVRSRVWPDLLEKGRMNPRFGKPRLVDTNVVGEGARSVTRALRKRLNQLFRLKNKGTGLAVVMAEEDATMHSKGAPSFARQARNERRIKSGPDKTDQRLHRFCF